MAEEIKKENKAKKIVLPVIMAITGLIIGGFAGYFVSNGIKAKNFEENNNYTPDELSALEDDIDDLMNRYKKDSKENLVQSFKHYELVNIAYQKLYSHKNYKIVGKVNVLAMGINQVSNSVLIKNNDEYFMESLSSSSLIKSAKRYYQKGDEAKAFNGNVIDATSAKWETDPFKDFNLSDFKDYYGRDLTRGTSYIVSSKTTLDSSTIEKNDAGYLIKLDLDPALAVKRYVKQMMAMSDISMPEFSSIHIEYQLDNFLNLVTTDVNENYSVVFIIKANSKGTGHEDFFYEDIYEIPDLNTNYQYLRGE